MKPIALVPMLLTRVTDEIRAAILSGDPPPGTRVKQEQLALRLGVSCEPVKKALLLLEREGLVRAEPNRSATVAPLDRRSIEEIYQFREGVEMLTFHGLTPNPKGLTTGRVRGEAQ